MIYNQIVTWTAFAILAMFTSVLPHKWRPYYKGRISNSSLYSWGDLIPQCISELLCLPSLFECYQDCKHTVAGKQKHMSPSCVVIIVEKIPELLFWIFLMGWSTIYLNVDGGRSLQMNKQIWIHSCVLKNYDWEPSIILPIEWIIWFVEAFVQKNCIWSISTFQYQRVAENRDTA